MLMVLPNTVSDKCVLAENCPVLRQARNILSMKMYCCKPLWVKWQRGYSTMSNEQKKVVPPLQTITANTLLNTDYPPLAFSIEKLLPQGILSLQAAAKSASHGSPLICALLYQLGANCGTLTPVRAKFYTLKIPTHA